MLKYEKLILDSINEEIKAPTLEDLLRKVRVIFESEMIYGNIQPSWNRCKDWLQGLCSTVEIPFMDHDIILWLERQLKRPLKEKEYIPFIDAYWDNAAKTLYTMLYNPSSMLLK